MSLRPKKARVQNGGSACSAWWYDERGGISVYIVNNNSVVLSCRIKRSALIRFIERSGAKGKK